MARKQQREEKSSAVGRYERVPLVNLQDSRTCVSSTETNMVGIQTKTVNTKREEQREEKRKGKSRENNVERRKWENNQHRDGR